MEELVKRLRRIAVNERSESSYQDVMQAADAVEKLTRLETSIGAERIANNTQLR